MYKLRQLPTMPALKELPKEPDCECPKRPELKPVPEFDRTMKLRKGNLPIKPSVRFTRTTVLAEDVTETPVETPKAPEVSHRVYYLDQETGDEVKPSETLNEGVNALELNAPAGYTFVRTEKLPNGDVKHYYKKAKVEPTKPSEPLYEKPAVEKPTEPVKPVEPTKPTEPIKPVEPTKPVEPNKGLTTKPADDKKGSKVDVPTDAHNEPAIVEKPEDHKKGTKVEVPTDDTKKDVEPVKDVEPTKSDDTKKGSKLELPTDEPKELKEDPQDSSKATTKEDAKEDPKAKEEKPKDTKPAEHKGSAGPKEDAKAHEPATKSTGKKLPETGDPMSLGTLGLASLIGARKLRRKK